MSVIKYKLTVSIIFFVKENEKTAKRFIIPPINVTTVTDYEPK